MEAGLQSVVEAGLPFLTGLFIRSIVFLPRNLLVRTLKSLVGSVLYFQLCRLGMPSRPGTPVSPLIRQEDSALDQVGRCDYLPHRQSRRHHQCPTNGRYLLEALWRPTLARRLPQPRSYPTRHSLLGTGRGRLVSMSVLTFRYQLPSRLNDRRPPTLLPSFQSFLPTDATRSSTPFTVVQPCFAGYSAFSSPSSPSHRSPLGSPARTLSCRTPTSVHSLRTALKAPLCSRSLRVCGLDSRSSST